MQSSSDPAVEKALGMLEGIQWLLRTGRTDPKQPNFSDTEIADMLDRVTEQLRDSTDVSERT
ncbi:hypothetical protein J2W32_006520 [Variovorax boronicumulans]|uniref:Transcriptional regulator n=1 Tax=Variovorax boronicumulans TaxID=436515 RepID=A0AAW8D4A6_9BURK|nr:hypothetical protein [Variovorax boronicumulans]MDQ0057443.1 hypothetical protein [Variovorax boronicumulans]